MIRKITVKSYSGYTLDEKPTKIIIDRQSLRVEKILGSEYILDNQTGNRIKKFKIQASDNKIYTICLNIKTQSWYLTN